jgi:hypothetical protein
LSLIWREGMAAPWVNRRFEIDLEYRRAAYFGKQTRTKAWALEFHALFMPSGSESVL